MSQALQGYVARKYRIRRWKDSLARFALFLCAVLALVPLFSVFGYVVVQGIPGLQLSFFLELPKPVGEVGGGMANALLGTLVLVGLAGSVGVFWGGAAGIYLSEYGGSRAASWVRLATEMLASVPSIVVGLFIYSLVVARMGRFSAIAGGLALGILMIPTVARSTEEILRLVPVHIREAGLALGLPRWKVILRIVVRGVLGGLTTGIMLAVARVAGETAPLLFTALNNHFWPKSLVEPIASLPVQIFTYAISPFDEWHKLAWSGALVLVVFVFVTNLVTRWFLRDKSMGRSL